MKHFLFKENMPFGLVSMLIVWLGAKVNLAFFQQWQQTHQLTHTHRKNYKRFVLKKGKCEHVKGFFSFFFFSYSLKCSVISFANTVCVAEVPAFLWHLVDGTVPDHHMVWWAWQWWHLVLTKQKRADFWILFQKSNKLPCSPVMPCDGGFYRYLDQRTNEEDRGCWSLWWEKCPQRCQAECKCDLYGLDIRAQLFLFSNR